MIIYELTITRFDSMENDSCRAIYHQRHYFYDGEETAQQKIAKFLDHYKYKAYSGWDNEIYPQFTIKEIMVL